ncbi:DNA repair protein RAD51 homolog 4-like [Chelonus insularis]|uniref:DNA repair protein RAD51 homolog 4-like n=1 Tax=Chelonus insularis TaxID=460826 RepID=UPI00158D3FFE|nr:DNA repair protein RAD51 homolog 4-like [Chelonus insularis]
MSRLNPSISSKFNNIIINKLQSVKIFTVFDFVSEDTDKLVKITELTFKDIEKIKKEIVEKFGGKIKDPFQLFIDQKSVTITGISALDSLLGGGLYPGRIYEICGKSSSGKSQLCYTLAVNIAVKSSGTIIHYIYTKKDFSASRIQMILENKKLDDEVAGRVMNQINTTHAKNVQQLFNVLYDFTQSLKQNSKNEKTKLIIIDSLPGVFVMSEEKTEDNFSSLNHLTNVCHFLANEYALSIITVNSVTQPWREIDGFEGKTTTAMKPTLGKYWLYIPNTRLLIEKGENESRTIKVWMCEDEKINSSVTVTINNAGVY